MRLFYLQIHVRQGSGRRTNSFCDVAELRVGERWEASVLLNNLQGIPEGCTWEIK